MDQGLFLAKDKANWIMEMVKLWDKMTWWAKFNKNFSKRETQLAPWMKEGVQNPILVYLLPKLPFLLSIDATG
jgi:hypothetical protein